MENVLFKSDNIDHKIQIKRNLKKILKDLLNKNKSKTCPGWSCYVCVGLFPKSIGGEKGCPCSEYSKKYLIKRLKDIIKANK